MKGHEPMNWTKRQTQRYGVFIAILAFMIGVLGTNLIYVLCYI